MPICKYSNILAFHPFADDTNLIRKKTRNILETNLIKHLIGKVR